MNLQQRRVLSSILSAFILIAMFVSIALPLGGLPTSHAQETTEEPPVDTPTELPPDGEGAETPPDIPSEETAEPPVDSPPADQPVDTPVPPIQVIEPELPSIYTDDFQDGDTNGWVLSTGWSINTVEDNSALITAGAFETATISGLSWDNLSVSADFGISNGNSANIAFRVGVDNYNVTILADGQVNLYQGLTLLAQGIAPTPTVDEVPVDVRNYTVNIQAVGTQIVVNINGVQQLNHSVVTALPAGSVIFSTGASNTGIVTLDNVSVQQLDIIPVAPVAPTQPDQPEIVVIDPPQTPDDSTEAPTEEPVVVIEETPVVILPTEETPVVEITEEISVESTPEVEATEEAPAEVTPEAETTEEAPVAESTPDIEATPEVSDESGDDEETTAPQATFADDFEGDASAWLFDEGASIVEADETTHYASLSAGSGIQPVNAMFFSDMQLDASISLVASDSAEIPAGASINLHIGENTSYTVVFDTIQTALYRNDGDVSTLLASSPTAHNTDTWYSISVSVVAGQITVSVDGATEIDIIDDAPLSGGTFSIVAHTNNSVLLDNIAVYDLAPASDTAETPVPFTLTEAHAEKLSGVLFNILSTYLNGDLDGAIATASDFFLEIDAENRVHVALWAGEGQTGADLLPLIQGAGGVVTNAYADNVEAFVSFDGIIMLVDMDEISAIYKPETLVSTSLETANAPQITPLGTGGTVRPHSLDHLGVNDWHLAGVRGGSVSIAIIDTGFVGANAGNAEQDCLASSSVSFGNAGVSNHGINVVEVICDIAPDSAVYMYQADTTAELESAVTTAANNGLDLIVITVDGTDSMSGGASGVNTAIQYAYDRNIPVIASAGNSGTGSAPFSFDGSESRVRVQASAGAIVSYSWQDAGDTNYSSSLHINGDLVDSRNARAGESNHQYVMPRSCGDTCEAILVINGPAPTTINVEVLGGDSDNHVMGSEGGMTPQGVILGSSLTTAAESPFAIAVGAVCAAQSGLIDRYELVASSSRGPVGQGNNAQIKPEIVAPSYVRTSLNPGQPACGGAGFSGTSASAAHVAGMAALLFSNSQNAAMFSYFNAGFGRPTRLESYLITHATELYPNGGAADGFDRAYGAGLAMLGNPDYNINQQFNYTENPYDGVTTYSTTNSVFVGVANINSTQNGTQSNPYINPAYAIQQAIAQNKDYVVFQPGEYVASFNLLDPGAGSLTLISFDGADQANRFPSSIWVSDTFYGQGGVTIGDVGEPTTVDVGIIGFDFIGSTPLYLENEPELALAEVSPIHVINADGVMIAQNTFTNFDAPMLVDSSTNVTIFENTFDGFNIPSDLLGGINVPRYPTAALHIAGDITGLQAVEVEGNAFLNSTISQNPNASVFESVVLVEQVGARLLRNRFENNTATTGVAINQWIDQGGATKSSEEVIIYSSLFEGNNFVRSIVHLFQGPRFRFVNNTVANHNLGAASQIITVGNTLTIFGDVGDHLWDIHNNLFFNNFVSELIADVSTQPDPVNLNCDAIAGGANNDHLGTRYNWVVGTMNAGECGAGDGTTEFGHGFNNNTFTALNINDPVAVANFETATFFMNGDPENPYRLLPDLNDLPNSALLQGIDDGNRPFVEDIMGVTYDLNNLHFDVMGLPRMVDPGDLVTPIDGDSLVDIGAYELSEPEPVSLVGDGTVDVSASEDQSVITIALDSMVTGGFRPYNFTLSNLPTMYDANPLNACGGQPISYDPLVDRYNAFYCPPADFYTVGAPAGFDINFNYTASGQLVPDQTPLAVINVDINPLDDGRPTRYTNGENEMQVIFTDLSSQINRRLAPYYDVVPTFSLSEPDNDNEAATPADTDYPFTISNIQVDAGAPGYNAALFGGADPNTTITNSIVDGTLTFQPALGVSGAIEFTYDVTDADADTGNRRVRIVVTPRLAEIGLHDDTSLDFVYSNGWTPFFNAAAINDTQHYTNITDVYTDFYFIGDAFVLELFSWGTASFEVLLDPDDIGGLPEGNHNTFGDLTCSTGTQTITGAGKFQFGCGGIESIAGAAGQLHRIRIINKSVGSNYLAIDAVSVRGIGLPAGYYPENDFAMSYTGGWSVGITNASAATGSYSYTTDPSATMSFNVDGSRVDTAVIYRTMGTIWGSFDVYINGILRKTVTSAASATYYNQPIVISGIGGGLNTIEIRNASANWIGIEAIELFGPTAAMPPGLYAAEDARVNYAGTWYSPSYTAASNGVWTYSSNLSASLTFNINGNGVSIYRSLASTYGPMEICVGSTCQTFSSYATSFQWGVPATLRSSSNGLQTVTIRSLDAKIIAIDSIEVLASPQPLGIGLYEETNTNLTYSGSWVGYAGTSANGTRTGTNDLTTPARLNFQVDATAIERIAIQHTNWGGTYQICGPTAICEIRTQNGASSATTIFTKAQLGLTGANQTVTLTVQNGWIDIDAIELLGAPGPIGPGYYEETNFNFDFSAGWFNYAGGTGSRDGTLLYTNNLAHSMTFRVDATQVDRLVIYYPNWAGTMRVSGNSNVDVPMTGATARSYAIVTMAQLNLSGNDELVTISKTGSGGYIGIEAIHALPNASALGIGSYEQSDSNLAFLGNWTQYASAYGGDNLLLGTNNGTDQLVFHVDPTQVDRIRVFHEGWGGTIQICANNGANCVTGVDTAGQSTLATGTALNLTGSDEEIVVRRTAGWISVRHVELLGQTQPLNPGYYEETNSDLTYGANWVPYSGTGFGLDGTMISTNNTATSMTFLVNADAMDRIAINHNNWGGILQICRNTNDNCQTATQNSIASQAVSTFTKAQLGLSGASAQVTIRTISGWISIESIEILAPQSVLGVGTYEENNSNFTYQGGWADYTTTDGNNTQVGTNEVAASMSFRINANQVGRIVVKHAGWGGTMRVCASGGTCTNVVHTGVSSAVTTSAINASGADVTITITTVSNWISIKSIELVPAPQPLGPGHYEETNSNLTFTSGWAVYPTSSADGTLLTTNTANAETLTFRVDATQIDRIGINHINWGGTMRICRNTNNDCQFAVQNFNGQTIIDTSDLGLVSNNEVVTISTINTWITVESLDLYAPAGALGAGYYEQSHPDFVYAGTWASYATTFGNDKLMTTTNDTNATLTLRVNATQVDRIQIRYPIWGGNLQICRNTNDSCQTRLTTGVANGIYATFTTASLGLAGADETVTIRTTSGWIGIESIRLLANQATLTVGGSPYEENDSNLTYSGYWPQYTVSHGNGIVRATNDTVNSSISFVADGAANYIVVRTAGYSGTMQLCANSGANCVTATEVGNALIFNTANLNFGDATELVTIKTTSGWISVEAIEILNNLQALTPGFYQDNNFNLIYTGTWTTGVNAIFSGGTTHYSNVPGASFTFDIDDATGFVLFLNTYSTASPMNVCITPEGQSASCTNGITTATSASYRTNGRGFFGLRADTRYTVTVTHAGTGAQWLDIDAIGVLAETSQTLTLGGGGESVRYDGNNSAILFGPNNLWSFGSGGSYYNSTWNWSTYAGAVIQMTIEANSATVYMQSGSYASGRVGFCLVVEGAVANTLQCNNFSMFTSAANPTSPITLYGFGFGEHDIILENQAPGYALSLDAIDLR